MSKLTHLDEQGAARMVDVGDKPVSERIAVAGASVKMQASTLALLRRGDHKKGDVLAVARIAGIQAAKKTPDLIPLCHTLLLNAVKVEFELDDTGDADEQVGVVRIRATCKVSGKTGVEMEALTAASVAALTIYDMCKAVDRGMEITDVALFAKEGGQSGTWRRDGHTGGTEG